MAGNVWCAKNYFLIFYVQVSVIYPGVLFEWLRYGERGKGEICMCACVLTCNYRIICTTTEIDWSKRRVKHECAHADYN